MKIKKKVDNQHRHGRALLKGPIIRLLLKGLLCIAAIRINAQTWQHPYVPFMTQRLKSKRPDHWYAFFPTIGLVSETRPTETRPTGTRLTETCLHYPYLPHFFTLHELAPQKGNNVTIAVIDTKLDKIDTLQESHAQHTQSLLNELCPRATIIFINAFEQGICNKALLIKAIQKAVEAQPDILVLPLKLDDTLNPDTPASKLLNNLLSKIPYVIAAAGNGGITTLAYPARLSSVTLSTGAFGVLGNFKSHQHATCFVPPFSQYEEKRGPTFLLPGIDIYTAEEIQKHNSITSVINKENSDLHTGTSSATVILAGFLALMLAENRYDTTHNCLKTRKKTDKNITEKAGALSKNHLLTLITTCTVCPTDDEEWHTHSLHGVPDMRTSLLILQTFKKSQKNFLTMSSKKFNRILNQTHKGLLKEVNHACKNLSNNSSPFSSNLISSISSTKLSSHITKPHHLSLFSTMKLDNAINYTQQFVQRRQVIPRRPRRGLRRRRGHEPKAPNHPCGVVTQQ